MCWRKSKRTVSESGEVSIHTADARTLQRRQIVGCVGMSESGEETTHFELTLRRGEALFEEDWRQVFVKGRQRILADACTGHDDIDLPEVATGVILQQ